MVKSQTYDEAFREVVGEETVRKIMKELEEEAKEDIAYVIFS